MTRIRSFLCFWGFHKFIEHPPIQYFEIVSCSCCKRRWAVNTRNQKLWELPQR